MTNFLSGGRIGTGLAATAAIAALLGWATAPAAAAAKGADYYKGKTVTYIVATSPGGGYDFYARLTSQYMKKHLPGTIFVVKNKPGGGHIIGANLIYNSKANGLTIGMFNTGLIYSQVIGKKGIRFDLAKMSWIGKAAADPRVITSAINGGPKTLAELKGPKTWKFSSGGVGSSGYNDTMMMADVLGWKMKMILGYRGTQSELAMRRGEIHVAVGSLSSAGMFVKNGYGRFLAVIGGKGLPGVPQLIKVVESKNATAIAALIGSQAGLARFTAGPPGIPADRLAALRAAYKVALEDKLLRAQAAKAHRPIVPAYGDEVRDRVRAALNQPPDVVALVRRILKIKAPTNRALGTKLLTKTPDGRWITFMHGSKTIKSKISGSRTKIKIAGKKAKRKALAVGMNCDIEYKLGKRNEPKNIECK